MGKSSSKPLSLNNELIQIIQISSVPRLVELVSKWPYLVHKPINDNLITPLMLSCISENLEMVELLLEHYKVSINEQDYIGFTALHHCVYKNSRPAAKIAEYLCQQGINLSIKSDSGITALNLARTIGNPHIIKLLEYQEKFGKWAMHPFHSRKVLLWVYPKTHFKVIPKSIIKEICLYF